MLLKLIASLLLLSMMSCTAVKPVNTDAKINYKHDRNIANQALVLKDEIYEIQQNSSTIKFRVDSPFGEVWGSFHDFEGSFIMLDNGTNNQSAVVTINTESLHVDSTFIKKLLKSEMFFNVEKCPSIHFAGGRFEWINDKNAVLNGYMTLNNITRLTTFHVELVKSKIENNYSEHITVKASTTIKRSDFGIHALLPAVSDKVSIYMDIDALKKNTTVSMM